MVRRKLCCDVVQKCLHNKSDLPEARLLSEARFENSLSRWFLVYRWFLLFCWLIITVCSILDIGSFKHNSPKKLWMIYLTHWDLLLGLVQSLLGFIVATKRWRLQRVPGFDPDQMKLSKVDKAYWCLYVITASMALGVTITYWVAVHNPKIHVVDPLNIMLHVCNSLLMLIDLFVSNVTFKPRCFWWCPLIVFFYYVFSFIYYSAGGLDKNGNHYIYKILDWEKPQLTILVCFGGLLFAVVLHFLLCLLTMLRDFTFRRMYNINKEAKQNNKNQSVDVIKMKKSELIV